MKKFVLFVVLFSSCSIILVKAKGDQDCKLLCPVNENRPVCGSDGKTYRSKCLLRLNKCTTGTKLHVDYTGPCKAPQSCSEDRKNVLKSIRDNGLLSVGIHIPDCDRDDTYSVIQCHKSPAMCWCVDKFSGHPLEKSKQPDCRARPPRSHPYPLGNDRYSRIMKGCSKENRISFNKKSVAMFKKEMTKSSKKKGKLNFVEIVQWKMQELDADKNGHLQHKEVKGLMKKLKKAFSPRKCGKTLFYYCDKDHDYTISKKEWLACLGLQGLKPKTSSKPDVAKCLKARETARRLKDPKRFIPSCNADGTYTTVQCEKMSKYCWCVNPITGRNIPNTAVINAKPDCTKHLNPTKATRRIPMRKSLLKPRMQLHTPSKVNRSTKHERGKRVKECDDLNWTRFSQELVGQLRKEFKAITGVKSNLTSQARNLHLLDTFPLQHLPDAMIMAWKFSHLDVNTDRLVHNNELFVSHMKKVFGRIKRGRKCSKRLLVTCDADHNSGLSLVEWRSCLQQRRPKSMPGSVGR